MRLPGAQRAGDWEDKARRYVAAHRALDEIEVGGAACPDRPPLSNATVQWRSRKSVRRFESLMGN